MGSATESVKNRLAIVREHVDNAAYSPFSGLYVLQQRSEVHKLDGAFSHNDAYPGQAPYLHQKSEIDLVAINL